MPRLRLSASGPGEQSFPLTTEWQEYAIEGKTEEGAGRCWIGVSLVGSGTAWIDLLQFRDISPIIRAGSGIFVAETQVALETSELDVELRYTLDGSDPTPDSRLYAGPITVSDTATVKAASFRQGVMVGDVVEAALTRVEYLGPEEVEGLRPGIEYAYYEGSWTELPDFEALSPVARGLAGEFGVLDLARDDYFAFRFTGYIRVPEDGIYRFATRSDDGSKLLIGDREVVSNDGLHGRTEQSGSVALRAGLHPIVVTFFEHVGAAALEVYYEGPNIVRQPIPASALWYRGH